MNNNGQTTRVVAFDTNTMLEYHFPTIRECARELGLDCSAIYRCLAGQQRQTKGFLFCREDGKTKWFTDPTTVSAFRGAFVL